MWEKMYDRPYRPIEPINPPRETLKAISDEYFADPEHNRLTDRFLTKTAKRIVGEGTSSNAKSQEGEEGENGAPWCLVIPRPLSDTVRAFVKFGMSPYKDKARLAWETKMRDFRESVKNILSGTGGRVWGPEINPYHHFAEISVEGTWSDGCCSKAKLRDKKGNQFQGKWFFKGCEGEVWFADGAKGQIKGYDIEGVFPLNNGSIYAGQWDIRSREPVYGALFHPNHGYYSGYWSDYMALEGTIRLASGFVYEGYWNRGQPLERDCQKFPGLETMALKSNRRTEHGKR